MHPPVSTRKTRRVVAVLRRGLNERMFEPDI